MLHDLHPELGHAAPSPFTEGDHHVTDGGALGVGGGPIPAVGDHVIGAGGGGHPSASELAYDDVLEPLMQPASGTGDHTEAAAQALHRTLRFGARGADVLDLQGRLNAGGEALAADGVFGAKTYAAVVRFQAGRGLAQDGVVGKQTWAALDATGSPVADRVLETLDRNGDTASSGAAAGGGNLLGTPAAGGHVGATPAAFKQAIDHTVAGDSAAEYGQRLWYEAIGAAVIEEARAILAGANAGLFAEFTAIADAIEKKQYGKAAARAGKLVTSIHAAPGLAPDQIARLTKLASANGPSGSAVFHALWAGYDTNPEPHAVPPQYRSLGAALNVRKYEAEACAEVAGIGAQRYYKQHAPQGKVSFKGGTIAGNSRRYTERHGDRMLGDIVQYNVDPSAKAAEIQDALAAGYTVVAHVLSGTCYGEEKEVWADGARHYDGQDAAGESGDGLGEHWLLIIGSDGTSFDFWNPSGAGGAFGKLYARGSYFSTAQDTDDLYVHDGHHGYGRRRYQVVSLALEGQAGKSGGGGGKAKGKTASLDDGDLDHQVAVDGPGDAPDHAVA